jgi:hypothetical protein
VAGPSRTAVRGSRQPSRRRRDIAETGGTGVTEVQDFRGRIPSVASQVPRSMPRVLAERHERRADHLDCRVAAG